MVTPTTNTRPQQAGYTLVTVIIISVMLLAILSIVLQYIAALAIGSRNINQFIAAQNTAVSGMIGAAACEERDISVERWNAKPKSPCVPDGATHTTIGTNTPISRTYDAHIAFSAHRTSYATVTQKFLRSLMQISSYTPWYPLQPSYKPTRISTSETHSCVVAAGKVYCWGRNNYGQLGNGIQASHENYNDPVAVDMSSSSSSLKGKLVTDVVTGHNFTCALSGSEVHCWGRNNYGQLGNGTTNNSPRPIKMDTLSAQNPIQKKPISQLAVAGDIACAVAAGEIYCWGLVTNWHTGGVDKPEELTTPQRSTETTSNPIRVGHASWGELNTQPVSQIALTYDGICAIASRKMYCWGNVIHQDNFRNSSSNEHKYRFGSTAVSWGGDGETRLMYTHLNSGLDEAGITSIVAGSHHVCAIDGDNELICWGGNGLGQLGIGTKAGDDDSYYWQDPSTPALSISRPTDYAYMPREEYGVQQVASSGASWYGFHTCALTNKHNVYCWGSNIAGQLGNGNYSAAEQITAPRKVNLHGLRAEQIATSLTDTCAIAGGKVYCWGQTKKGYDPSIKKLYENYEIRGRYITALPTEINLAPLGVKPEDLKDYTKPANGYCTTSTSRSVYCWGYSSTGNNSLGQLGDGTKTNRRTAVSIQGKRSSPEIRSKSFTQVATGLNHACALGGGKVYCWGANNQGQLGDGRSSTAHSPNPVEVDTSAGSQLRNNLVTYIAAGKDNSCAISEGKVYCWGKNNYRQSSGSSTGGSAIYRPVAIDMSSNQSSLRNKKAVQLAIGDEHSCALASDNTVHCWGRNNSGQLGNGSNTDSTSPVQVDTVSNSSKLSGKEIVSITAGYNHTCAITTDNLIRCWGANNQGQLGNQTTANQNRPVESGTGPTNWEPSKNKVFHSVAAAGDYTCTILTDDIAKLPRGSRIDVYTSCWGVNDRFQLLKQGIPNASIIQEGAKASQTKHRGFSISAHPYGACLIVGREPQCWGGVAGITRKNGRISYPNSSDMQEIKTFSRWERPVLLP